ncbi:MAG: metal ABC transporter substrate-binding protein [Treponema sp.]|nr:metal ABC transporter substrate-binding protein [Treponema sp.]
MKILKNLAKNTSKIFFFSIIALTGLISCSKNTEKNGNKSSGQNKISVVATTFPCYDAVRAISGDFLNSCISLKLLVKPGMEVHSYDPSPADIISIQKSDLFVYVGGESDEWIEKILNTSSNELKCQTVELIHFVNTLDEPEFDQEDSEEDDKDSYSEADQLSQHEMDAHSHHSHSENIHEQDEHIWTSPENEIIIVRAVCTYLQQAAMKKGLSDITSKLDENTENYCAQIEEVARKTEEVLQSKSEKFLIMADRFPFTYFANYYGLEFDAAFSGCSTAVEASTATISRLIDTVKEKELPAVFYIELGNHKIADSVAESTKTKALLLESCQNVTKNNFQKGESWVTLMTKNAETLNIGLR